MAVQTPNRNISYAYNPDGSLQSVTTPAGYRYEDGLQTKPFFPNDTAEIVTYDELGRVDVIKTVKIDPVTKAELAVLASYDYEPNPAGDRTEVMDHYHCLVLVNSEVTPSVYEHGWIKRAMNLYSELIFPRLVDWGMQGDLFRRQRQDLLAQPAGRVLEIGFGTGLNLPFYSKAVTQLTAVDPNPGMSRLARQRIARAPFPVDVRAASAETLPLPDNQFDWAVSTWTLCSIPDVLRALEEIRRVLVPGGQLAFIEHGLSEEPGIQRWQHRLTPLQQVVGDGCRLNRDFSQLLPAAGLICQELEQFYTGNAPKILGYTYRGIAIKG